MCRRGQRRNHPTAQAALPQGPRLRLECANWRCLKVTGQSCLLPAAHSGALSSQPRPLAPFQGRMENRIRSKATFINNGGKKYSRETFHLQGACHCSVPSLVLRDHEKRWGAGGNLERKRACAECHCQVGRREKGGRGSDLKTRVTKTSPCPCPSVGLRVAAAAENRYTPDTRAERVHAV